jgi:catechol 2,3-dioxygenase-like lactoylglutathione lyase family enzyme
MKLRSLSALALLCAAALLSTAQAPAPTVTGIAHVAYRVSDLDRETAFLLKLGYEQSFSFTTKEGNVSEIFVKINDRQFLELYPQTSPSQPLGWMHVCYESDDIAPLAALYAARGLKPIPVKKAGAGNLITAFNDPEGRTTEFTQYMPGSRHTLDQGKHLGANRVSQEIDGIEFPVPDLAAARKFYADGLGFETQPRDAGLRVRITTQPWPWIQLNTTGAKPELLFRVPSVKAAARQLRALGLAVTKDNKSVSIADPDGNTFVFIEDTAR